TLLRRPAGAAGGAIRGDGPLRRRAGVPDAAAGAVLRRRGGRRRLVRRLRPVRAEERRRLGAAAGPAGRAGGGEGDPRRAAGLRWAGRGEAVQAVLRGF